MPTTVKVQLIVRAFDIGASDCVAKPFSPSELTASTTQAGGLRAVQAYVVGDLTINHATRRVDWGAAALTPNEFDLLTALSTKAGRVVGYDRMLRRVWCSGMPGHQRVLRIHPMHLHRKLGEDRRISCQARLRLPDAGGGTALNSLAADEQARPTALA